MLYPPSTSSRPSVESGVPRLRAFPASAAIGVVIRFVLCFLVLLASSESALRARWLAAPELLTGSLRRSDTPPHARSRRFPPGRGRGRLAGRSPGYRGSVDGTCSQLAERRGSGSHQG